MAKQMSASGGDKIHGRYAEHAAVNSAGTEEAAQVA
jgi:hypothetical protein